MTHRIGEQLGKYRLVRLLGQGSFADVYLGEHLYLQTHAAVKVLRTQLAKEDAESFLNEAQTIARLVHPHIIRIFDFDVQEGTPFLVMDYAPNGTLRQRHPRHNPIPPNTVVYYVKQIADALQYAHEQRLIHRDVKPENVLLGRRNEVLLSDFGIVQPAQATGLEVTQKIVGTMAYMAPEQLQGKSRIASDQYALGVMTYEWLSGERPFEGVLGEIASQHLFTPPPPLRGKNSSISPAVEEVVMTTLAKDPKQRFASVRAFAMALEQAIATTSSVSPYAPTTPTLPPPAPSVVLQPSTDQQQLPSNPTPSMTYMRPYAIDQQSPAQQQQGVVASSSRSSTSQTPVFTDPPHQVQQQLVSATHSEPPSTDPGRWKQQGKRKVRYAAFLIVLAILVIAATSATIVLWPKPATTSHPGIGIGVTRAPDGEYIGISDGTFAFDTNRPDGSLKNQAAEKLKAHDSSAAVALWQSAIQQDTNDAEALIYLEDQRVLASHAPYITLIVGIYLTKDFVSDGRNDLQGAYVAQKEYNDGSKLPGGVQVRLLIANAGSKMIYATTVAKQIVQAAQVDKTIVGVMGLPYGNISRAMIQVLSAAHIPMVSPTASDDLLTSISHYFFRVVPSDKRQVAAGAQYAENTLQASRAALFVDPNDGYSKEVATDFEQQFITDGKNIVAIENYSIGHPAMLPGLLQDDLKHSPDMIYFAGNATDAGALLTDLPTSGPFANLQVIGTVTLYGTYPDSARANFKRLHFTSAADPNEWSPQSVWPHRPAFFTEYARDFDPAKQHRGNPYGYTLSSATTMLSYDAMLALLAANQSALAGFTGGKKLLLPGDLQQALTKITGSSTIQGATGQISFGFDGNPVNKAVVLLGVNGNGHIRFDSVLGPLLVGSIEPGS